jgi:CheY-like chemotaxis protein
MTNNDYALVIEDSLSMRQFVSAILHEEMHIDRVLEAEDPDQALKLLRQQAGHLALIISDWNMPGMSLSKFMQRLELLPGVGETPIFLLSAASEEKVRKVADEIHARAILTKPFDAADLVGLVTPHLQVQERRRAKRVIPITRCEVDLGFDDSQPCYHAEVLNISETGVLTRSPIPAPGTGCVYDLSTLTLLPEDDEAMRIHARVVRLEADPEATNNGGETLLMAFDFAKIEATTKSRLHRYIVLNDPDSNNGSH